MEGGGSKRGKWECGRNQGHTLLRELNLRKSLVRLTSSEIDRALPAQTTVMDFQRKIKREENGDIIPTYPAQTLALHVAVKGAQLGSCAGAAITLLVSTGYLLRRRPRPDVWRKIMAPSTLSGAAISSAFLYENHMDGKLDEASVDDRAYRIANNHEQLKVDRYGLGGFVSGAISGVIVGQNLLSLSCTGLVMGLAFYEAERRFIKNKDSKTMDLYKPKWMS